MTSRIFNFCIFLILVSTVGAKNGSASCRDDQYLCRSIQSNDLINTANALKKGCHIDVLCEGGSSITYSIARIYDDEINRHNSNAYAITELLLKNGAEINYFRPPFLPILNTAIENRSPHLVKYLLEKRADPNVGRGRPDNEKLTPLRFITYSAVWGTPRDVSVLLEIADSLLLAGADIDDRMNVYGTTPIMDAISTLEFGGGRDLVSYIDFLLKKGASVTIGDRRGGRTALHFAASAGYSGYEAMKLLVRAGAKKQARDNEGRTPLDLYLKKYETSQPNPEIIKLLEF